MLSPIAEQSQPNLFQGSTQSKGRHLALIERTYANNQESDYTEQIESLGKEFNYEDNSHVLWGDEEFSYLYGTPLYDQASESQRLGMNHLYWVSSYYEISASEANVRLYNQITSGVFSHLSDYGSLCAELDLETAQERVHIQTFQRILHKTKLALLGRESFGNPQYAQSQAKSPRKPWGGITAKHTNWERLQESGLRWIARAFLGKQFFSEYLQERIDQTIPITAGGFVGLTVSPAFCKFLSLNWGGSPFLATHYYTFRMIGNLYLKAFEYNYYKHFKTLTRQGEFIPVPTAVSHYHLLDEAFHTILSKTIAQDVYRDFKAPNPYETLMANLILYMTQLGFLSGLSGALVVAYRDDATLMPFLYRLFKSRLFGMTHTDALHWIKQCLCQEHEGFHANLQHHQKLFSNLHSFFSSLDYLWPINKELQIMQAGGSIGRAIDRNQKAFNQFVATLSAT